MNLTRVAAAALAALLAAACASQAPMPDLPGTPQRKPSGEIRKDPNADQALAQVEATARGQPKPKQVETYLSFRKAYPETTAGQEALYRAGVLSFEQGDYVERAQGVQRAALREPALPQGRGRAAQARAVRARARGATATRTRRSPRWSTSARARRAASALEDALGAAAEGAQLYGEALKLALKAADRRGTPEERTAALAARRRDGGGAVGFLDVAEVRQDLPHTHPAWPLLTFKLARIYYHLRDWTRLEETLQSLLARGAPSTRTPPRRKALLARAAPAHDVKPAGRRRACCR